jgi:hypothetical protein
MKLQLDLDYDWAPVTCNDGSAYSYPKPVRDVRGGFHGPAVYRWRFVDGQTLVAVYFGECDDVVKELNTSVNPGPANKSAGRIKSALGERMLLGQTGLVDVLKVRSPSIGGAAPSGDPLRDRQLRRAIENLLVHEASKLDVELLNQETSARDLLSLL